jgi:hypothetical protein
MWAVIWGQTSKKMQLNLEAKTGSYEAMENGFDILELLKEIKIVSNKFDVHQKEEESLSMAIKELAVYRQGTLSINDYYKEFNSRCGVIEQFGGTVGLHPVVTALHLSVPVLNFAPISRLGNSSQRHISRQWTRESNPTKYIYGWGGYTTDTSP